VVEEINEGSVDEMHVVNNMLRESAKKSFAIEDCSEEIAAKKFEHQTQEMVVCDVVVVDNITTLTGVKEKNGLVTSGLQEEVVISMDVIQKIKDDFSSGVITTFRNEGMLEKTFVEFFESAVMAPKKEDGEDVSTIGGKIFKVVEPIRQEMQQLLEEDELWQAVEEMRGMLLKAMQVKKMDDLSKGVRIYL